MKETREFKIKVYNEAAEVIEKVLIASTNDFKTIITREAQQKGQIADPNVVYDKATRTVVIEEYPKDKGTVLIVLDDGSLLTEKYSKIKDTANYAQLEPTKGCYCVYVKSSDGIDRQVNVALDEDSLVDVFGKITNDTLLEEEKATEQLSKGADIPQTPGPTTTIAEMPAAKMTVSSKESK